MLDESSKERVINKRQVREMRHEAGISYLDFTPVMLLIGAMIVATRYVAMGMGDKTLYVAAGIGAAILEYPTDPIGWFLAAFFSLMPDIDLPTSKVGRPLFWISSYLERHFGHRTITHSGVGMIILAILASPLLIT